MENFHLLYISFFYHFCNSW